MNNNRAMNNNRVMNNNKKFFDTSTFVIIIVVLFVSIFIIYTYRAYKTFQNKAKEEQKLQSRPAKCPDYWEVGDGNVCKNVHLLGSCSNTVDNNQMNFDDEIFTHPRTGNYAKCKWAKGCNLEWQGVNNLC